MFAFPNALPPRGPSNAAAERGEEVGVDANLERPRRVSGTAKQFGNFAANTDMTALLRTRFFDIRPAPCLELLVLHLTTIVRRFRRPNGQARPDAGRADNSLIFTNPQVLG